MIKSKDKAKCPKCKFELEIGNCHKCGRDSFEVTTSFYLDTLECLKCENESAPGWICPSCGSYFQWIRISKSVWIEKEKNLVIKLFGAMLLFSRYSLLVLGRGLVSGPPKLFG
jgi:hypothetical protein